MRATDKMSATRLSLTVPCVAARAITAVQRGDLATAGRSALYSIGICLLSWWLHGSGAGAQCERTGARAAGG